MCGAEPKIIYYLIENIIHKAAVILVRQAISGPAGAAARPQHSTWRPAGRPTPRPHRGFLAIPGGGGHEADAPGPAGPTGGGQQGQGLQGQAQSLDSEGHTVK